MLSTTPSAIDELSSFPAFPVRIEIQSKTFAGGRICCFRALLGRMPHRDGVPLPVEPLSRASGGPLLFRHGVTSRLDVCRFIQNRPGDLEIGVSTEATPREISGDQEVRRGDPRTVA